MVNHTLLFVLGGCVLGAIQLVAGVALGMWIRRADPTADASTNHDLIQANIIGKRLQDLTDEMSSSVGEHRNKLDQATQLLTSGNDCGDEALAELVVDVIGEIVRANQSLKTKL